MYSDFTFATLILNTYLLSDGNSSLGAASSYVIMFINITVFAFTMGYNFTLQNYSGQCFAKEEYRKMNLFYRQTAFFGVINYLILCVGGSIILPYVQSSLGMDVETITYTGELLRFCLPAMFVRTMEDNLKYLLRGQGIIRPIGIGINISFFIFLVYSYLIMEHLKWGSFGYGLSLFIYECSSISTSIYSYFMLMDPRVRDCSFPIRRNMFWFFRQSLNVLFPLLVTWVVQELLIIVLTLLHSDAQLGAYAQLMIFPNITYKISDGFQTVLQKNLNTCLGRKQYRKSISLFWQYSFIMLILLVIMSIAASAGSYFMSTFF